jgi:hypothetical protein
MDHILDDTSLVAYFLPVPSICFSSNSALKFGLFLTLLTPLRHNWYPALQSLLLAQTYYISLQLGHFTHLLIAINDPAMRFEPPHRQFLTSNKNK